HCSSGLMRQCGKGGSTTHRINYATYLRVSANSISNAPEAGPPDDPAIPSSSSVYRRFSAQWWVNDGDGGKRLSSQAFQDHPKYVSVGLGVLIEAAGADPYVLLEGHDGYGLAQLSVGYLRQELHFGVVPEPTQGEPFHGGIHGKKTGSKRSKCAKHATVIVAAGDAD
ncbi:MAG TPA: hypothetical protein VGO03_00500, partial [Acidimicrobiia bacterium]